MNDFFSRITPSIDVERMQSANVVFVGAGGAAGLVNNMVRCGLRSFTPNDFDHVTPSNIGRQAHDAEFIGRPKVEAVAIAAMRTNPDVDVHTIECNLLEMTDDEIDVAFGGADLLVFATDSFAAQARGNEIALRLGKPAIWIGLYQGGQAGEVIWWHPGIAACFRCLCSKRRAAHERAAAEGRTLDPVSDGCTIFDITLLDAIAGMIAVGLLTRGADNRFGRLIDQLGDRNFIQVQLDPLWQLNGRNPIREYLGVAPETDTFFAWNTTARRDPANGNPPCPDCLRWRNRPENVTSPMPMRPAANMAQRLPPEWSVT